MKVAQWGSKHAVLKSRVPGLESQLGDPLCWLCDFGQVASQPWAPVVSIVTHGEGWRAEGMGFKICIAGLVTYLAFLIEIPLCMDTVLGVGGFSEGGMR